MEEMLAFAFRSSRKMGHPWFEVKPQYQLHGE
jgi:hypothetical protein